MEIPKDAKKIMQTLENAGFEAYVIGGSIRDYNLGLKPKDYDIFTNANGDQLLKLFPKGKVIGNKERQEKILTVIVNGIEVSQYRKNGDRTEVGNNLDDHLKTCDFTINALANNLDEICIDNHNGLGDLRMGIIRCVGDPKDRFDEDILRVLRAIRFVTKYNFMLEEKTEIELRCKVLKLYNIPQERVKDELFKMLGYSKCFENLFHIGILELMFPSVIRVHRLNGGRFHDEFVLAHMDNSYKQAIKLTDNKLLQLSIFLHDIGKAQAFNDEDGKVTFYQHHKYGADLVVRDLKRLKFSNKDIEYVRFMVYNHMFSYLSTPTKKTYIRLFRELEERDIPIEDFILLNYCDNQGNTAKPRIKYNDFLITNKLYKKYYECKYSKTPFSVKDLEINGHDVVALGITDGKDIGKCLQEIFKLVSDGKLINDRHRLLGYLNEYISNNWTDLKKQGD